MDDLYIISLVDYGLPSFCSGMLDYMGTKEEILDLLRYDKRNKELLDKVERYFNGEASVFNDPPRWMESSIYKTELKEVSEGTLENFESEFINVWDFPYYMRAKNVKYRLCYVSVKQGYARFVKAEFEDLEYSLESSMLSTSKLVTCSFWGYPGMIRAKDDGIINNTISFADKIFGDEESMLLDMNNPAPVNFDHFFFDIFGDG